MAAINISEINWTEIEEQVPEGGRKSSGMVDIIDRAARAIMKDGKPITVNRLQNIIQLGLNQGLEDDEKITIHWATVSHMLTKHDGFKPALDEKGFAIKNTFVYDAGVKKNHGKASRITRKH